jgi:ABC-type transport system involved in multi-copper enzyme maturation permease subunit
MRALLYKEAWEIRGSALAIFVVMIVVTGAATVARRALPYFAPELFVSHMGGVGLSAMAFPSSAAALHDSLRNALQVGGFATLILGAGAIAGERDRHTLELLLSRPVTPRQIVLTKALVRLALVCSSMSVAAGSSWLIANFLYDQYPLWPLAAATLLPMLLLCFLSTLAVLASVVFRTQVTAILGAGGACLLLYVLSLLKYVGRASPFAYLELSFRVLSSDIRWSKYAGDAGALVVFVILPLVIAGYLFERRTV